MLGPLEVVDDDGVPVQLGGPRPRALLAQLLLQPNRTVSTDRLIDGIWGEAPPSSGAGALQVHVHALRKALGADRIVTQAPGYLVRVEPGELDRDRFERLAASGRTGSARRSRSGAGRPLPTSPTSRSPRRRQPGSKTPASRLSRPGSGTISTRDATPR